jgi:hypothetical protein
MDAGIVTNLLVLYNLDSSLQYDGKLRVARPLKLNPKKKFVKCEWSKIFKLHAVEDVTKPVSPEYMHASELPITGDAEPQKLPDTGTGKE